jgi:YidC/Oxa1 family membrane protein insertase
MDENNRNFLLAIVLSIAVLFVWQMFFGLPQHQQQDARKQQEQAIQAAPPQPGSATAPALPGAEVQTTQTREQALAASPRIAIETPSLKGSIALKGGRIDDLVLMKYRETVESNSANVVLLTPQGSEHPYFADYGWVSAATDLNLPNADTEWTAQSQGPLTAQSPVTLTYDNGKGLLFTRTVSVDENYMFTVADSVANKGTSSVSIAPYGLVLREELPATTSYYILHEGLIGVFDQGYEPLTYSDAMELNGVPMSFTSKTGWLGIADKYWAAVLVPPQGQEFKAQFNGTRVGEEGLFRADFVMIPRELAPGATTETKNLMFAGAKEVNLVDIYGDKYSIPKFDLLIDWGWFYFLTKPMFYALDFFYKLVGNFGLAILIVTLIIKIILFPLANKSYVSMSKMKLLAPEMQRIKERFADDKMRQQQAMMDLYKKEKVNPASGCLPILVQIPIFFALYKVLFVTIEMRHAPFYGWIKDLSAPDPTNIFNLFGLLPFDPSHIPVIGAFLAIGIWPLIMGITMWMQMKLNPAPPDPVQQKVFAWMPVFFTFLLAGFPAGLVIYWAWNNTLSVIQQSVIMARQGVEIPLMENLGIKKKTAKGAKGESKG